MSGFEEALIYDLDCLYDTVLPKLTDSINNLAEKIDQNNNKFYQELDKAGITVEDFTGHIGAILGMNTAEDPEDNDALLKSSWDFMQQLYEIATKCL